MAHDTPRGGKLVQLRPDDTVRLIQHFQRLGGDDRQARFGHGVSDSFLRKYAETTLWVSDLVLGYETPQGIVGAGELIRIGPCDPLAAEIAFSVERSFQHRGVGGLLFDSIVAFARKQHLTTLTLNCHAENGHMIDLARRHGARVRVSGSEAVATLALSPGDPDKTGGLIPQGA